MTRITKLVCATLIALVALTMFVSAVESTGKYVPSALDRGDGLGVLDISVLCHHNLFSQEIIIQMGDFNESVYLSPDGTYDGRFTPGTYNITLLDGDGGHPEYQTVTVYPGYESKVRFKGHAVSGHGKPIITPTPEPTITPEPTPTPDPCHEEKVWHIGYWSWHWEWVCGYFAQSSVGCIPCHWVLTPHWNPGYWETIIVCW